MRDDQVISLINDKITAEFELDAESMEPSARLIEDLGLDSLDLVDLVVLLQEELKINLREDPAVRDIRTLGNVHALVLARAREGILATDDGTSGSNQGN